MDFYKIKRCDTLLADTDCYEQFAPMLGQVDVDTLSKAMSQ